MSAPDVPPGILEAFQLQAEWCRRLGSELYARILEHAGEDVRAGGPVARLFTGWSGNPVPDAVVLRLMGGVHWLVLSGAAPELARHYPSAGGSPGADLWERFLAVAVEHADFLRERLRRGVQTNEVNRSAALLGGFLRIAELTGLPLSLREIGSSAGLNQHWDRYRYAFDADPAPRRERQTPPFGWGDPRSTALIRATWVGPTPPLAIEARVEDRAGCDLAPVDIGDDDQLRLLESFVWADQLERLAQLRAAAAVARRHPVRIDRSAAPAWLETELARRAAGTATVVFHSIVWWYLSEDERTALERLLDTGGSRATRQSPLAWLRMEMLTRQDAEIRLKLWPPGDEVLLALADPHGRRVEWQPRPDQRSSQ